LANPPMSVEVGLWRVDGPPGNVRRVAFTSMPNEAKLEEILAADLSILDPKLLLIGRQVLTDFGKYIDLLALDADGRLIIIELKRDLTPREVVAQTLDYGSWILTLKDEDIAAIFDAFQKRHTPMAASRSLDEAFKQRFQVKALPDTLNDSHELLIVAGELDPSTERIVAYLANHYDVPINVAFFRFFQDGDAEYLSRAWLLDPTLPESTGVTTPDGPWNGECYVSFGEAHDRKWSHAVEYGYIAGGGGAWYSNTLKSLVPGERVWVNVPSTGYVGVGRVLESAVPITVFEVARPGEGPRPIIETGAHLPPIDLPDEELEFFVRVKWLKTVPLEHAVKEVGFFGNQNTVARPRTSKWNHTIERLKQRFGIVD
jgi:hypothetical protein